MAKLYTMLQLSQEWFDIKRGKIGASSMGKIMAKGKGKTRRSYLLKLAAEILTGETTQGYTDKNLETGIELEPKARAEYENITGETVEQIGWAEMANGKIGCSPDGLPPDGLLEIKCVIPTTQIDYCSMPDDWIPPPYKPQVHGQMWVCERPWCDFVSYSPKIKSSKYIRIVRVERNEEYIKELKSEAYKFLAELNLLIKKMK